MSEQKCRKVYVPVNLDVDAEGNIRPRLIRWIDGRVYEIDRLKHKCRAASTKVSEPSAEMQIKIIRAKDAIASQKPRIVRCPYCRHNSIIVFEDTRGHVQTKCKACGRETVFNVLEMRRLRRLQLYYSSLNG